MMNSVKSLLENTVSKLFCLQDVSLVLIRLILGIIFIQTGLGKLMFFSDTVPFFASIGIPFPAVNAVLASGTELLGGICLLFGLGTRLVSLPLIFVMMIAILTAKWSTLSGFSDFIRMQEVDYIVFLLILVAFGSGKWSLDCFFCKRKN